MTRLIRTLRQFSWIILGVGLLSAVYLLPPDTSLARVRQAGALSACVPAMRPPLVTGEPGRPGVDIELLEAVADRLGVSLRLNTIGRIGQDFDPRSWGLTRAQCAIIAGGLIDSPQTRSYLETSPAYAETGWLALAAAGEPSLAGRTVGVLATIEGSDRIALARFLRAQGARPVLLRSADELVDGLAAGRFQTALAERLVGEQLAAGHHYRTVLLPMGRARLVFGLWKGDLTLKRAVEGAIGALEADGRLDAILARYGIAPLPSS